jgi:putative DNA-invertase from lambdoid prophage Rac
VSRVFAYCRVSTFEQTTSNQIHEIQAAGFNMEPRRVLLSASLAPSRQSSAPASPNYAIGWKRATY